MRPNFLPRCVVFVAVAITVALSARMTTASITINSNRIQAAANDLAAGFGSASSTFTGTSLTSSPVDAIHGGSRSENDINWSTSGGQTILSAVMDHHRTGAGVSFASEASLNLTLGRLDPLLNVTFSVDAPTPYSITGRYDIVGTVNGAGNSRIYAGLVDTSSALVFFSQNSSAANTKNVAYALGGSGSSGNLSGTLPIGTYRWSYGASISGNGDSGADGDGYFTLTLGTASDAGAVPEATSFLVWGVLGLMVAGCSTRRRDAVSRIAESRS